MAGTLYVVATPIGNLEDVTLRALRILREVAVIAAEDTRRTARLLQHYSISTPATSLHEHNEALKTPKLIERLRAGDSIALVSDAGTPLVSDPGQTFVSRARHAGIKVEAIPGPSAVLTALAGSGVPSSEFAFLGFPPIRSKDRNNWLARLVSQRQTVVFFEAPHRIRRTLEDLATLLGSQEKVVLGRELTKIHEELVERPIIDHLAALARPRGEFTIIVPRRIEPPAERSPALDVAALRLEFGQLTDKTRATKRQALKLLAGRHGVSVNELYRLLGVRPN